MMSVYKRFKEFLPSAYTFTSSSVKLLLDGSWMTGKELWIQWNFGFTDELMMAYCISITVPLN